MSSSWNCGPLRRRDGLWVPFHVSSDTYLVLLQISHPHLMRQPLAFQAFNTCLPPSDHILNSNCIQMNVRPCGLYIHMPVNISFYLVLHLFLLLYSLAAGAQLPPHIPDNCTVQYLLMWCLEIRSVPKKVS